MTADRPEELLVPKWFVRMVTTAIVMATPWVVWVTVTLLQVQFNTNALGGVPDRYAAQQESLIKLGSSVERIADRLTESEQQLAAVQAAALERAQLRFDVDRLKLDVEQLKKSASQ